MRIVIINGRDDPKGYWTNEVRDHTLLLLTHCSAAMELVLAWSRREEIYWYRTGRIGFIGPLSLSGWQREGGFFRLHLGNIATSATPLTGENARGGKKVLDELKRMRHLITCDGSRVDFVNMEHPRPDHPDPAQVETLLRAAGVRSV
jgi:hypothetical protein